MESDAIWLYEGYSKFEDRGRKEHETGVQSDEIKRKIVSRGNYRKLRTVNIARRSDKWSW